MKLLWTASDSMLSKAIRGVTGEDCSHVAIQDGNWIIHSNLRGVNVDYAPAFLEHARVQHSIEVPGTLLYPSLTDKAHSWYDIGALLFSGLALLARHYFRIPLPKSNLWQSSGMYMCTEWVQYVLNLPIDSMITPHGLFLQLEEKLNERQ